VVGFALQHRGQVHDVFILMQFATALAESGRVAEALNLFSTMLRLEHDRPTQRAVIKRCLDHCWGTDWGDSRTTAWRPAQSAGMQKAWSVSLDERASAALRKDVRCGDIRGGSGRASAQGPLHVRFAGVPRSSWAVRVAPFVRKQHAQRLLASEFVGVLEGYGVPHGELLALCAELLSPQAQASASGAQAVQQSMLAIVPTMMQLLADALADELSGATTHAPPCQLCAGVKGKGGAAGVGKRRSRPIGSTIALATSLLGLVAPPRLGRVLSTGVAIWLVGRMP
jgi:hypothetical protein